MAKVLSGADIEAFFPQCPDDVTEHVHRKQYDFYRKWLIDFTHKAREMLLPLGEQQILFILGPLRMSLLSFLQAKRGKQLGRPQGKPLVKSQKPVVPLEVKPVTTEEKSIAEAGSKPQNDE